MQNQSQSFLPFEPEFGLALERAQAAHDALLRRVLPAEAGVHDELRDASGALRPAWARIAALMPAPPAGLDGPADLDRRVAEYRQMLTF